LNEISLFRNNLYARAAASFAEHAPLKKSPHSIGLISAAEILPFARIVRQEEHRNMMPGSFSAQLRGMESLSNSSLGSAGSADFDRPGLKRSDRDRTLSAQLGGTLAAETLQHTYIYYSNRNSTGSS
jgi:hypothetical protein